MLTPEQGARTIIHLASSPEVEGLTGRYFDFDTKQRKAAAAALDEDLARKLWELSARLVKLEATTRPA